MITTFNIFENNEYNGFDANFFDDHIDIDLSNIVKHEYSDRLDNIFDKLLKDKIVSFYAYEYVTGIAWSKPLKGKLKDIKLIEVGIETKVKIIVEGIDGVFGNHFRAYIMDLTRPLTIHTLESDANKYNL